MTKSLEEKVIKAIARKARTVPSEVKITFINDSPDLMGAIVVEATADEYEYEAIVDDGNVVEVNML